MASLHLESSCCSLVSRGRFLEGESFIRKGEAGGWRKEFSPEMDRSVLELEEDGRQVDTSCGQFLWTGSSWSGYRLRLGGRRSPSDGAERWRHNIQLNVKPNLCYYQF